MARNQGEYAHMREEAPQQARLDFASAEAPSVGKQANDSKTNGAGAVSPYELVAEYAERSYLDYSMYVILDRALPHVADGLKPVQRRIVYAMSELGLDAQSKPRKSARTVGDVIGKFHPHGDSACYEAMVHLAQPFGCRHPLVDGHGNFGAPDDPGSFAAMRYTEARLSAYANLLLEELPCETVDWSANFDGSMKEPDLLPARLPNVLINGASGIAVGMSTDIPPHNIAELAKALDILGRNPECSYSRIFRALPGPDFPGGGVVVTPPEELKKIYRSGRGTLRLRASWEKEDKSIIIGELPFQTPANRVIEQIAAQIREKKLPMVETVRDESDHESPIRLVLALRSGRTPAEDLMGHLFATTDLERTVRVNLNMIGLDGLPAVKGVREILLEWLEFRRKVVRLRMESRLRKVTKRLAILEGLLIAYANIDEVIRIVRSEDHPKEALIKRFSLSEEQAEGILNIRLRRLARLAEIELRDEAKALESEKADIEKTLSDEKRFTDLMLDEIRQAATEHSDERRTLLNDQEPRAQAIDKDQLAPSSPVTVVLSRHGFIRQASGHKVDPSSLPFRPGDSLLMACRMRSNEPLCLLDINGRSYTLSPSSLPSARSTGEPLSARFDFEHSPQEIPWKGMIEASPPKRLWLFSQDSGRGFVTQAENLVSNRKGGKAFVSLREKSVPLSPVPLPPKSKMSGLMLATVSSAGYLLAFDIKDVPERSGGQGVVLIKIKDGERLVDCCVFDPEKGIEVHYEAPDGSLETAVVGKTKMERHLGRRAGRGSLLPKKYRLAVRSVRERQ